MDFFLWGIIKNKVNVPPLPDNLNDLRNRNTAVAQVTPDMRTSVATSHRSDFCRVKASQAKKARGQPSNHKWSHCSMNSKTNVAKLTSDWTIVLSIVRSTL
ncbi:uncharacterized protein LOC120351781 [Nilaparvata lugens]|uniref:uncharacterized protein LOC120351781 n=1 Tax=Nilaparvata lugens TaxID=108931 RepID=UPI00193D5CE7|nr:uncharacterized protein LOC120351781 [Nilaparvata lugens]